MNRSDLHRNVVLGFVLALDAALLWWLLSNAAGGQQPVHVQRILAGIFSGVFAMGLFSGLVPSRRLALSAGVVRLVFLGLVYLWPGLAFAALFFGPTTVALLMLAAAKPNARREAPERLDLDAGGPRHA